MGRFGLKGFVADRVRKAVVGSVLDAFIDCGFDRDAALRYADNLVNGKVGFCWFEALAEKLLRDEIAMLQDEDEDEEE